MGEPGGYRTDQPMTAVTEAPGAPAFTPHGLALGLGLSGLLWWGLLWGLRWVLGG